MCGFRDISAEPYAGQSGEHSPDSGSTDTTNGSGSRNLQLFVLAPDGTVVHALPGYWNPHDLVHELKLAEQLAHIWGSPMEFAGKQDEFHRLQMAHVADHSAAMVRRSEIQGFDKGTEVARNAQAAEKGETLNPSTIDDSSGDGNKLKTVDLIMHERMAVRPFVPFDEFDVADFVDLGGTFYDKHRDNQRSVLARVSRRPRAQMSPSSPGESPDEQPEDIPDVPRRVRAPTGAASTPARMLVSAATVAVGPGTAGSRMSSGRLTPPSGLVAPRSPGGSTTRFELLAVAGGDGQYAAVLRYRNQTYTVQPGDVVPDTGEAVFKVQAMELDKITMEVIATKQLVAGVLR